MPISGTSPRVVRQSLNGVHLYEKAEVAEGYEANCSYEKARLWDIAGSSVPELLRRDEFSS